MNDRKMYRLSAGVEHQCLTEDSKVRIYLSEVRSKKKETWFEKIVIAFLEVFYSLTATYFVGKWAIASAYAERGYKAYGGEYILIAFVLAGSFALIHTFFKNYRR